MNVPFFLAAGNPGGSQTELMYVWGQATLEAKAIIGCLAIFSIIAWSVMIDKALQMRRAKRLNQLFSGEFRAQKAVLEIYDRRVRAEGCPMFGVYQAGSIELDARLKSQDGAGRKRVISLKSMEHVKRALENCVAQESLRLESGLILLAIAVSGAPVPGPARHGLGRHEHLRTRGPAAKRHPHGHGARRCCRPITTVAGLLVAIPSMFGYNWLVHNLRVLTVELDNFAQELASKIETEYLEEDK